MGPYLGCYEFTDGTGVDSSGEGRDASCTGESCPEPVMVGGQPALRFDGVDDVLVVDHSPAQDELTGAFSISSWIGRDVEPTGNSHVVAVPFGPSTANSLELYARVQAGNQTVLRIAWDSGSNISVETPYDPLRVEELVHLATTWDGTELCIYLQGTLIDCRDGTGLPASEARNLLIGSDENAGVLANHWNGIIDDVCIWRRALSPGEVRVMAERR
jgi:hypothetical protein